MSICLSVCVSACLSLHLSIDHLYKMCLTSAGPFSGQEGGAAVTQGNGTARMTSLLGTGVPPRYRVPKITSGQGTVPSGYGPARVPSRQGTVPARVPFRLGTVPLGYRRTKVLSCQKSSKLSTHRDAVPFTYHLAGVLSRHGTVPSGYSPVRIQSRLGTVSSWYIPVRVQSRQSTVPSWYIPVRYSSVMVESCQGTVP